MNTNRFCGIRNLGKNSATRSEDKLLQAWWNDDLRSFVEILQTEPIDPNYTCDTISTGSTTIHFREKNDILGWLEYFDTNRCPQFRIAWNLYKQNNSLSKVLLQKVLENV